MDRKSLVNTLAMFVGLIGAVYGVGGAQQSTPSSLAQNSSQYRRMGGGMHGGMMGMMGTMPQRCTGGMGQGMMGMQSGMMRDDTMKNMREMMKAMMSGVVPPGIKPEELPDPNSEGARLTVKYCTQCHDLPSPLMHAADEWPGIADRMFRRMSMCAQMGGSGMMGMTGMMNMKTPSTEEQEAIVAYLKKHSLRSIRPGAIPSPGTEGAVFFAATCAQCHALPDPKQHTAQEWPQVVARMRQNMITMGKDVPDAATTEAIIHLLRDAARAKQ